MNSVVYYPYPYPSAKWLKIACLCWETVHTLASAELLIYGVFRFKGLAPWFDDNGIDWRKSIRYIELTERGKRLLQKLQRPRK